MTASNIRMTDESGDASSTAEIITTSFCYNTEMCFSKGINFEGIQTKNSLIFYISFFSPYNIKIDYFGNKKKS